MLVFVLKFEFSHATRLLPQDSHSDNVSLFRCLSSRPKFVVATAAAFALFVSRSWRRLWGLRPRPCHCWALSQPWLDAGNGVRRRGMCDMWLVWPRVWVCWPRTSPLLIDLDAAGLWGLHISLPVFLEFFVCWLDYDSDSDAKTSRLSKRHVTPCETPRSMVHLAKFCIKLAPGVSIPFGFKCMFSFFRNCTLMRR